MNNTCISTSLKRALTVCLLTTYAIAVIQLSCMINIGLMVNFILITNSMKFLITKIGEDGTRYKPFVVDLDGFMRLMRVATPFKSTFEIQRIE